MQFTMTGVTCIACRLFDVDARRQIGRHGPIRYRLTNNAGVVLLDMLIDPTGREAFGNTVDIDQ
jgi:hypothetical protein